MFWPFGRLSVLVEALLVVGEFILGTSQRAVRHPQYLAALLAHLGFSLLLSGWYSLLSTPPLAAVLYEMAWKEEAELAREFGEEYEEYRRRVPMLVPRLGGGSPG